MDILQQLPENLREPTRAWLATKALSTQTVYKRDLTRWFDHCAQHDIALTAPTHPQADLYIASLATGHAAATWIRQINTLSSWMTYLFACNLASANIFAHKTAGKGKNSGSATRYLSLQETQLLIETARTRGNRMQPRDVAIILLMCTDGIRVGEVCSLRLSALGTNGGQTTLRVRGKGGKLIERALPPLVALAIEAYCAAFPHEGLLFLSANGKPLNESTVFKLVQRLAQLAKLGPDVTPHSLRRGYGTNAIRLGANVPQVQHSMGHASSATTDGYIRADEDLTADPAFLLAAALV